MESNIITPTIPITDNNNLTTTSTPSRNQMEQIESANSAQKEMNALSPEIMKNQATINIGTLGHVGIFACN